jgi:hypothetical protein
MRCRGGLAGYFEFDEAQDEHGEADDGEGRDAFVAVQE